MKGRDWTMFSMYERGLERIRKQLLWLKSPDITFPEKCHHCVITLIWELIVTLNSLEIKYYSTWTDNHHLREENKRERERQMAKAEKGLIRKTVQYTVGQFNALSHNAMCSTWSFISSVTRLQKIFWLQIYLFFTILNDDWNLV